MRDQAVNGMKMIAEWAGIFEAETGKKLNLSTVRKRRQQSGIGYYIPPKSYLMTRAEFIAVLETPLPMCHRGEDTSGFPVAGPAA